MDVYILTCQYNIYNWNVAMFEKNEDAIKLKNEIEEIILLYNKKFTEFKMNACDWDRPYKSSYQENKFDFFKSLGKLDPLSKQLYKFPGDNSECFRHLLYNIEKFTIFESIDIFKNFIALKELEK